ncbi:MAG: protein kinase, partial [Deltaproteobacteria bacterium]
ADSMSRVIPEERRRKVGAPRTNIELLPVFADELTGLEFRISGVIGTGVKASVFRAENLTNTEHSLRAKLFSPEQAQGANLAEIIEQIVEYQSNMDDPNILRIIGTATLEGSPVILYEHLPVDAETILMQKPDGLPLDLIIRMLPQILNGLGYAHMHRGKDGAIRRLPHMSLKPSKLLLDDEMTVVKIDECGVCKALMDGRDYDPDPWDTLGTDPAARAPETFVLDSKFVNLALMDIYGLGALLYRLVTGQPPFSCASIDEYRFAHLRKYPVPPRVHRYDIPLWLDEMILKCLEKEPTARWRSATQMELALGTEAGKRAP